MPPLRQSRCNFSRWALRPADRAAGCCVRCWWGRRPPQLSPLRRLSRLRNRLGFPLRRQFRQSCPSQRLRLNQFSRQSPSRKLSRLHQPFPSPRRRPSLPQRRPSPLRFRLSYRAAIPPCEFVATSCQVKRRCQAPHLCPLRFRPQPQRQHHPPVQPLRRCKPCQRPCKPRHQGRLRPARFRFPRRLAAVLLAHGRFPQPCRPPRQTGGRSR